MYLLLLLLLLLLSSYYESPVPDVMNDAASDADLPRAPAQLNVAGGPSFIPIMRPFPMQWLGTP